MSKPPGEKPDSQAKFTVNLGTPQDTPLIDCINRNFQEMKAVVDRVESAVNKVTAELTAIKLVNRNFAAQAAGQPQTPDMTPARRQGPPVGSGQTEERSSICNRPGCGAKIFFKTSKKTGRKYPVDDPNDSTSFHSNTCRGQR